MTNHWTEQALINGIRRGDPAAVSALSETYRARIHRLATRVVGNPADGEEVAQDVLLRVWNRIGEFRSEAALSSWMFRITVNAAISRRRAERAHWSMAALEPDRASDSPPPDAAVLEAQVRRRLVKGLLRLPPDYRRSVLLRDVRGFSTREAARALRVNPQTLKSRLRRGRIALRRYLADFAGGPS